MKQKIFLIFLIVVGLSNGAFCLNITKVYEAKIKDCSADTAKINLYLDWHKDLLQSEPMKGFEVLKIAEKLSLKENKYNFHKILYAYLVNYYSISENKKALDYAIRLQNYCHNLKGYEKYDYQGRVFERMSSIYVDLENLKLAESYQIKALENYEKIKKYSLQDEVYFYSSQLNLANIYRENNKHDQCLKLCKRIEKKLIELESFEYLSVLYNIIGSSYKDLKMNQEALSYYLKSKDAVLKYIPEDLSSLAVALNNIGNIEDERKNYTAAIFNYSEALEIFKKLNDKSSINIAYFNIAIVYEKLKQHQQASKYMLLYIQLNDSLNSIETKKTIHDLSIKYESEKKEQQNKILAKENEKKQLSIYFALAGLILVVLILLIIYRNNRLKAKVNKKLAFQNEIIEEQKSILEKQHFLLEEKSKEVTDSIKYAERIQGAILPPDQKWNNILPNSFVLNKPKDILSGDFYWIADTEDQIFVAAADCTGHGVPGALISIVNFNLLNKAVLERGITSPAEILDAVNIWLTESLNQTDQESSIKDGMDISLISIDKTNGKVLFAGANNPLYLFKNDELIEVKADKFPVGAYINEKINKFTNKEIQCKFGDTIYLFSDGFADQFGGELGKKYKYRQFKEALFEAKNKRLDKQKEFLYEKYISWRGKYEQTDDILIIGIQI